MRMSQSWDAEYKRAGVLRTNGKKRCSRARPIGDTTQQASSENTPQSNGTKTNPQWGVPPETVGSKGRFRRVFCNLWVTGQTPIWGLKTPSLCVKCWHLMFFYKVDPEAGPVQFPLFCPKRFSQRSGKGSGKGSGGGSGGGSRARCGSGGSSGGRF